MSISELFVDRFQRARYAFCATAAVSAIMLTPVSWAQTPHQATVATAGSAAAAPAPAILLAKSLGANVDVSKYLVSEKLDGVRAVWDGSVLRFRSGNIVNAPKWFLAKLPPTPLDGELWLGRGKFDALSAIVRKASPVDEEWRQVQYMIFEQPNGVGSFEERIGRLQRVVASAKFEQLKVVDQVRLRNRAALNAKLEEVTKAGGEGLMLHLAGAPYTTGRSDVLLKFKPMEDAEAVVVKHIPGEGKYAGMLGALEVKTPDGVVFRLGTGISDATRKSPPAVGATVTYRYRDVTKNGVPRFASFLRERFDP